jgi:hypothetical protein
VRPRHAQPLNRDRHAIPDLPAEIRTPASNCGAEEKVQREVAVPSVSGHLSRVDE